MMQLRIQNLLDGAQCYDQLRELRWTAGRQCPHCDLGDIVGVEKDFPEDVVFHKFLTESLDEPSDQEVFMNAAQVLRERGRREGLEQGLEQGVLRGQRRMLIQLLIRRFGALPPPFAERIEAADSEQIARWGLRLMDAEHFEGVFED